MTNKPGMFQTAADLLMAAGILIATSATIWCMVFNAGDIWRWVRLTIAGWGL